jgi:hypothetical protein
MRTFQRNASDTVHIFSAISRKMRTFQHKTSDTVQIFSAISPTIRTLQRNILVTLRINLRQNFCRQQSFQISCGILSRHDLCGTADRWHGNGPCRYNGSDLGDIRVLLTLHCISSVWDYWASAINRSNSSLPFSFCHPTFITTLVYSFLLFLIYFRTHRLSLSLFHFLLCLCTPLFIYFFLSSFHLLCLQLPFDLHTKAIFYQVPQSCEKHCFLRGV